MNTALDPLPGSTAAPVQLALQLRKVPQRKWRAHGSGAASQWEHARCASRRRVGLGDGASPKAEGPSGTTEALPPCSHSLFEARFESPTRAPSGTWRGPTANPTGSLQAPSGTSHWELAGSQWDLPLAVAASGRAAKAPIVGRAAARDSADCAGRPPVRPRCPPRAQVRGRVGPGTPAHPRDAPLTHPLVLAGMSANEAPSQVRKRKCVTDAELSADQKHFLTQFVKAFVRKRPGPSRTASTAAAQGGAGLRAMDLLVRPCPRPPARRSRRPPHPNPSMPRIRRQTSWSTRWTPESSRISSPSRPHPRRSLAEVPLVRRLHS